MRTGRLGTANSRLANILLGACRSTGWSIVRFIYPLVVRIEQHLLSVLAEDDGLAAMVDVQCDTTAIDYSDDKVSVEGQELDTIVGEEHAKTNIEQYIDCAVLDKQDKLATITAQALDAIAVAPDDLSLDADAQMRVEE